LEYLNTIAYVVSNPSQAALQDRLIMPWCH
jgi:hypothetical protein